MTTLHLFDIDGTLVHVAEDLAFADAFLARLGEGVDLTYDLKAPITDMGYVTSVFERHLGKPADQAEVKALLDHFVSLLHQRTHGGELPVRAVAGATDFVTALARGGAIAVSTGCVEGSARLKLVHVGLDAVFRCGGFSIGERSRADVVRRAIAAAESTYARRFERVVLFGDGAWDLDSTREAGIEFIGINESEQGRARLRAAGAEAVFADYTDAAAIHRALGG